MWERGCCVERVGVWRRIGSILQGFHNIVDLSTNNPIPSYRRPEISGIMSGAEVQGIRWIHMLE